jgi:hypothetical protein
MVEVEVNGSVRGFRFGTNTLRIIRKATGIEAIEDVFGGLANKDGRRSQIDHIMFMNDFLWCCAQDYARSKKESMDFDMQDVSDWIDNIGLEKTKDLIVELVKSYSPKNQPAPETGQIQSPELQ